MGLRLVELSLLRLLLACLPLLLTDLPLLLADLGGIDGRAVGLEGALGDLLEARATPVNTPSNCRQLDS